MRDYIEQVVDTLVTGYVSPESKHIPNSAANSDFNQMQAEIAANEAQIIPYAGSQQYIDDKKLAHEAAITAEFGRVNLQDNYVVDLAAAFLWEDVINELVFLGTTHDQLARLNNNFGVARSEIAGVRQMTTVAEVDAYDPYTAPQWDLKP